MSIKRQRKAQRRNARTRKTASRIKAHQHVEVGASARARPHPDSVKLSDLVAMRAPNVRGPGEQLTYDYCAGDHGWFFSHGRAGWIQRLSGARYHDPAARSARIRSSSPVSGSSNLAGGCWPSRRTHVQATLASVFWDVLLPDGSTVCLESASDDEPASVSCAELADGGPIGFWASELGFERFDGEVALPRYSWMTGESQLPVALARRVGERWTDAYRVRSYDNASDDHEGIPPELCPPREQ